ADVRSPLDRRRAGRPVHRAREARARKLVRRDSVTEKIFLRYSAEDLAQLSGRIQHCLGKLTADQIWLRHSENENAVGNLVLHLCGNVRQWIGFGVGNFRISANEMPSLPRGATCR